MMSILNRRVVVIRKSPTHEGIGEGCFAHGSEAEDGNLSMCQCWIGVIVWHGYYLLWYIEPTVSANLFVGTTRNNNVQSGIKK